MSLTIKLKQAEETDEEYGQHDLLVDSDGDVLLICRDLDAGVLKAVALNTGYIFDVSAIQGKVRRIRATLTETGA